jgi:cytochrome P450
MTTASSEPTDVRATTAPALPPGPSESPLRQLLRQARDPVGFFEDCRKRFGDVYTTRLPGMPASVTFALPEAAKEIFANPGDTMWAGEANEPIEFLVGRHAVVRLDGQKHKRERKLMMPAVHGDRMVSYGSQMRAITDDVVSRFRPGDVVDVQEAMQEITLRVILESVFGLPPGDQQLRLRRVLVEFLTLAMNPTVTIAAILASGDRFREFLAKKWAPAVDRVGPSGGFADRLPWARIARAVRRLDELLYEEIAERRKVAAGRADVMSMLIQAVDEEGRGLSDDELRDEMMVLLVGGHETTATTLGWSLALSLQHSHVRDAVRAEYDRVFTGGFDPARIPELKYTEAVTKEALRLYPVASAVARRLKEPATIAGYALPAGVLVSPSIYHIQRDPKVWPDPLKFDPTRFVDKKPRPSEWLPFGGGVRTCLGMAFSLYEMKVVLSTVLRRAELRLAGPIPHLSQRGILLGPSAPIRVAVDAVS